jgi:hypothetical protein
MIIFLDEERAYYSWVTHHREGFVLDALRAPTHKRPVLHRATCADVRDRRGKRKTHWTTGRHLKACARIPAELLAWSEAEYDDTPTDCAECRPRETQRKQRAAQTRGGEVRLTKLEGAIVDCVVERAAIELDYADPDYDLTVRSVAAYVDKTPGQITAALLRLVERGYLRIDGAAAPGKSLAARLHVFPTILALRTLPTFAEAPPAAIRAALDRLEILSD